MFWSSLAGLKPESGWGQVDCTGSYRSLQQGGRSAVCFQEIALVAAYRWLSWESGREASCSLRGPQGVALASLKATSAYHSRWREACLGCPQLIPKGWPMPCSARCSNDNRQCPWKQSKSPGQNVCPGSACEVERRSSTATEAQRGMCPRSQDLQEGKTWVQEGKAPPWETPSLTPYGFVSFQRQPHQPDVGQGSGQVLAPPCFTPHPSPPIPHHCS